MSLRGESGESELEDEVSVLLPTAAAPDNDLAAGCNFRSSCCQ